VSPDSGTIMLVEDDPADARLIQRAFTKAGLLAALIRLTNGDDAVAYLDGRAPYENRAAHPLPSLLILDIKLPRRTGLEVLKWLRERNDGLRRLPTIMLTSSKHATDVDRAYDYGANSYLAKPETSEALLEIAQTIKKYWLMLNENPTLSGGTSYAR
jgi:CheY-like chemotaxis protein